MHALVQDRDDADFLIREPTPIDEVALIVEEVTLDAEFGGDGVRGSLMVHDTGKRIEHAGDVAISLLLAPAITGIAIDFVERYDAASWTRI